MSEMNVASVVNLMLETEIVRVCGRCEQERGPLHVQPGQQKSHGLCRRHTLETYAAAGIAPPASLGAQPESYFCPDLSKVQESEPRRCWDCEREHYGACREGSHGQCKRHWLIWAKQQGFTDDQIAEIIRNVEAGTGWPPDLGAKA